ncbi:hypothetical protein AB4Z14_21535 [Terrabacter sp. 2TAF16]|uniref:hypothetical protein n=1 Tax=Terrabacter sp. 2TAF16 TaxID=3233008 RepID=UPI003F97A874
MAFRYERTFAPSEELSEYGSKLLGRDVIELPIYAHYLLTTRAPVGGSPLVDWRDSGVQADYIKLMGERHGVEVEEKMRALAQTRDGVRVPDISTYGGRYLPPRILATGPGTVEDTSRNEYYEIKPDSEQGEQDGLDKLAAIATGMQKFGLLGTYQAGTSYPVRSPVYIPLGWSEAFEYLRLVFMWENNLKECELDLQVQRHDHQPGLLLYAFRIRLSLDTELALEKLRYLVAGVAVAFAACAAAGLLELTLGVSALGLAADAAAWLAAKLAPAAAPLPGHALPASPNVPTRVELPPEQPGRPRVRVDVPDQLPEIEVDTDGEVDPEQVLKQYRAVGEAFFARGYAMTKNRYDLYCDEDFFQNVVLDRSPANRFMASMRVGLPHSPIIVLTSAGYLSMTMLPFVAANRLVDEAAARFPNMPGLSTGDRIPEALRKLCGENPARPVSVVTQALIGTARLSAYLDPQLAANARRHAEPAVPGGALERGRIALPAGILERWRGRDAGAAAGPVTVPGLVAALAGQGAGPGPVRYLTDALSNPAPLKRALSAAPGFTVTMGFHGLYAAAAGPVTPENRYGELKGVNVSRMFALLAKPGSDRPGDLYASLDPARTSADPPPGGRRYRYLGRLKVGKP